MNFEEFLEKIGKKTNELNLPVICINHNEDAERYEIKLYQEPVSDEDLENFDILCDYIANELNLLVDGIGKEEIVYIYYNIDTDKPYYYDVNDNCIYQAIIKNEALRPFIKKMDISEEDLAKLEAIGIYIYQEYGHDCYNYAINGSPVNVEYIKEEIEFFSSNLNAYSVQQWAELLIEKWNE